MGKPKTPRPPDPYQTANAQTQSNIQTATANAMLNRINEVTPWGSSTYRVSGYQPLPGGATSTSAPSAPSAPAPSNLPSGVPSFYSPNGFFGQFGNTGGPPSYMPVPQAPAQASQTDSQGIPIYEREITLNPAMQQAFDNQTRLQTDISQRAIDAATRLPSGGLNLNALPGQVTNVNAPGLMGGQDYFSRVGNVPRIGNDIGNVSASQASYAGLPDLNKDYSAEREQVIKAIQGRGEEALGRRFSDEDRELQNMLANRGLVQGSEAYDREVENFRRSKSDAYREALRDAILGGGQEQSRMFNMALGARGQLAGEQQFNAGLSQQAQLANAQNALARSGLQLGAQQQGFNQALARDTTGFGQRLASQAQLFGQGLQNAQLQNQGRQQGLQEQIAAQNLPYQQLAQLMGMGQVQMPQFGGTPNVGLPGTDVAGLIGQNYAQQSQNANAQNQALTGNVQGAAQLAMMAYMLSSKGFKTPIGAAPEVLHILKNVPVEKWEYKPELGIGGRFIGPYAEDWAKNFGGDGKTIPIISVLGVILKSIQEIGARLEKLEVAHASV